MRTWQQRRRRLRRRAHALEHDVETIVYLLGRAAETTGDARTNLDVLKALGIDVVEIADAAAWELHGTDVLAADLIVDALVGTGLTAPLAGLAETIVADVNASPRPVVAIDLPSGLSADRPEPIGPAMHATTTVTLGAPKLPLVLPPAEALAGHLIIAEIGIPRAVIDELDGPWIELLTKDAMRALVEPRSPDSHKGDYGRVLIVAGSRGKTGAAGLAALAALRSGAGLVTVATPASLVPIVAALGLEFMTLGLDEDAEGRVVASAVDQVLSVPADVIAVGPGLGRSPTVTAFVQTLVERCGVPIVLDADGLQAFAGQADRLVGRDGVDVIITPHPGEMASLTGLTIADVQGHRLDVARDFATTHRVHVVLKGHRTTIASPEGRDLHQPHRQSGHGHGRNRRRADRCARELDGAVAGCGKRRRSSPSTFTGSPAISRKPTKDRPASSPATSSIGWGRRCSN